jgi:hypothetical protein
VHEKSVLDDEEEEEEDMSTSDGVRKLRLTQLDIYFER